MTAFLSYHPSMLLPALSRIFASEPRQEELFPLPADEESTLLKTIAWVSAGLGAIAFGLFVGRELRQRYKFNRRTPYDFYAHSGDEPEIDFGLGI